LYAAFDKARASKAGVTALMGAARGGHRQVVEVLLAAGADQGAALEQRKSTHRKVIPKSFVGRHGNMESHHLAG
jgi:ankyrin repeat protein